MAPKHKPATSAGFNPSWTKVILTNVTSALLLTIRPASLTRCPSTIFYNNDHVAKSCSQQGGPWALPFLLIWGKCWLCGLLAPWRNNFSGSVPSSGSFQPLSGTKDLWGELGGLSLLTGEYMYVCTSKRERDRQTDRLQWFIILQRKAFIGITSLDRKKIEWNVTHVGNAHLRGFQPHILYILLEFNNCCHITLKNRSHE